MTNKKLLHAKLIECGYTGGKIAAELGISRQSFSCKLNNKIQFKVSEIQRLCELLNISNKDEYFFYS